jgi:hypothetical protein
MSPAKVLKWVGLVLSIGALGVVIRLCLIRRGTMIIAPQEEKDELKNTPELLLKESVNLSPEALVAEKY